MSSGFWQTAIAMEGYPRVLKMISRPEDNSDRLICPLHELQAPVQKAREKCTRLLQLYCFVTITQHYIDQCTANTVPADFT